jgi:hypothetical protein
MEASPDKKLSRPCLEKPFVKKGWWSGTSCRPLFQAPLPKKKKKITRKISKMYNSSAVVKLSRR